MKKLLLLLILLALVATVSAATSYWTAIAGTSDWADSGNWSPTTVPVDGDMVVIGHPADLWGPPWPIIDEDLTEGGTVMFEYITPSWHAVDSELTVATGGNVTSSFLILGNNAEGGVSNATLNIAGGIMTVSSAYVARHADSVSEINISAGHLHAGALTFEAGSGNIDLSGGILYVTGDVTVDVAAWVSGGEITAFGGSGTVQYDFDMSVPGLTTIKAVPPIYSWEGFFDAAWLNDNNWNGGSVPPAGSEIVIDSMDSFWPAVGSEINSIDTLKIASTPSSIAQLSAGLGSKIYVGTTTLGEAAGSNATLIKTGGYMVTSVLNVGVAGDAAIHLDGGLLHAGSIVVGTGANQIDVTLGELVVNGDITSDVAQWEANGVITAYSGDGVLVYDYDISRGGMTTVSAAVVDFNSDGAINVDDLSKFAQHWLEVVETE